VLAYAAAAAAKPELQERAKARSRELLELCAATGADTSVGLLRRCGVDVSGCGRPGPGTTLVGDGGEPLFPSFPADFGERPRLASLGPLAWAPFANAGFELPWVQQPTTTVRLQRDGRVLDLHESDLDTGARRPTLVVFYLGFGCLQCVEQLHALAPQVAAFAELGVDVVAIGNDPARAAADALAALPDDKRIAFPLLADPELTAFRAWHCFDEFESLPLHGTFLVDADGAVRWQDVGANPFTDFAWLLAESRRLLAFHGAAPRR
jgi:peroxiredoxin